MEKKSSGHESTEPKKYNGTLEHKIRHVKREYRTKKAYSEEDRMSMDFCAKCGSKVSRVYSFCPKCGTFHDEFNFRQPAKKSKQKR
ncbi:MAG: zinc ribbon domain-containing protein [Thaumarchaeota archaeon]|nr:zinc ribbon domain-containing protein [Nitrososphaerota archaeon]